MAVASLRRRAGQIEIENKEKKIREELAARQENSKPAEVSQEEHDKRLEMLKSMGILKD